VSTPNEDLRELGPWGQAVALSFRFLFLAAGLIGAGWLVSNFHQIPPDSQAVVMRFGSVARIRGSGLLLAWPRPIEQVVVLPAAARQLQLPIRRYEDNQYGSVSQGFDTSSDPRFNSGFLLTGDSGVVHLEARVLYQINDPLAYMIAADHVEPALERLFLASAVVMMAGRDMDSVLVARPEIASEATEATRRERLRSDLMNAVNRRLVGSGATGGEPRHHRQSGRPGALDSCRCQTGLRERTDRDAGCGGPRGRRTHHCRDDLSGSEPE